MKYMKLPLSPMRACTFEQHPSLPKLELWLSLTVPGQKNLPWKEPVIWEGAPVPVKRRNGKKKAIFLLFWASRIAMMALYARGPIPFP